MNDPCGNCRAQVLDNTTIVTSAHHAASALHVGRYILREVCDLGHGCIVFCTLWVEHCFSFDLMFHWDYLRFGTMVCLLHSNCYLYCNFIQNFIFICTQTCGKCLAGYNVNYQTLLINLYNTCLLKMLLYITSCLWHFISVSVGRVFYRHILRQDCSPRFFNAIITHNSYITKSKSPEGIFFFLVWCAQKQHMKSIGPLATYSVLLWNGRIKREE